MLVGVGAFGLRGWSEDGAEWSFCGEKRASDEHAPNLLRAVGYGGGVFIAVGGDMNGMVMRTLEPARWQVDVHPKNACANEGYPSSCLSWMGAVAYLDGVWLAGGGNGATMRSNDGGVTWQGLHTGFPEKHIRSLGAGSERFIAGTDGGALFVTRDDGESWTMKAVWKDAPMNAFLVATHGNGTFVAYSGMEDSSACFVSSNAGDDWQACDALVAKSRSFVFDATEARWVAPISGGYATSSDAKAWTMHSASDFPSDLLFDGETWFGGRGDAVYRGTSLDALSRVATEVSGFRAWTVGRVLTKNSPGPGAACSDNR